jgi:hypothetical protein
MPSYFSHFRSTYNLNFNRTSELQQHDTISQDSVNCNNSFIPELINEALSTE